MRKWLLISYIFLLCANGIVAQSSPDYNGGFKIKLDEEGKKYLRILTWAQVQGVYNDNLPDSISNTYLNLRRARILAYAQINDDFLILTHFGLNSLNADNLSPLGKGESAQLFFHGMWAQYNLKKQSIGAGLHYWNGISRLNNQSTLNFLTLDNNRQSWATFGLSDQFGRHLGIYAKGSIDRFQYRVSINDVVTNGLDDRNPLEPMVSGAVYGGKRLLGSADAGYAYAGYFEYHFLDQESQLLPFKVGTYLGDKKVFNVGAGFFYHPNGAVIADSNATFSGEDVGIFAVDVYYDAPLGENGSAVSAYAVIQSNDYGENYLYNVYGTGTMFYTHAGYLIPGDKSKTRFQPFASFASNSYDSVDDNRNYIGLGANAFFSGHNSKMTLEYRNEKFGDNSTNTVTLQAMIYL